MNETDEAGARSAAPLWNIISIALPLGAAALGVLLLASNPRGGGDFAGAIGSAVLFVFGVGVACGLGVIAAVIALARGERRLWLTLIGLAGNGIALLPLLTLLLRD